MAILPPDFDVFEEDAESSEDDGTTKRTVTIRRATAFELKKLGTLEGYLGNWGILKLALAVLAAVVIICGLELIFGRFSWSLLLLLIGAWIAIAWLIKQIDDRQHFIKGEIARIHEKLGLAPSWEHLYDDEDDIEIIERVPADEDDWDFDTAQESEPPTPD